MLLPSFVMVVVSVEQSDRRWEKQTNKKKQFN